jgi:arginyl-tRNA synthetase
MTVRTEPDAALLDALRAAREQRADYGRRRLDAAPSVQIEFVSANPTGPLTVAHGRGAALGDALANLLEWTGHRVTREFYVNDTGTPMERFAEALEAALGVGDQPPADGFIADIAAEVRGAAASENLVELGARAVLRRQRETLERFGVRFDEWFSERSLHESGRVPEVVALLRERGHTYDNEGALWLRSGALGDTQDHPLLRSNGRPAYITGDLAYHLDKFRRGFDRIIDVWGPEHGDYVGRTRAGVAALGCDPNALEVLIFGPVSVRVEGVLLEASAASGNKVTLDDVIEKAGPARARLLYLSQPFESPLEIDLDALAAAADDPLTRVGAAERQAAEIVGRARARGELPGLETLVGEEEGVLARKVAAFPNELSAAAAEREPHRLLAYGLETSDAFTALADRRGGAWSPSQSALAEAVGVVLRNVRSVLGAEDSPPAA